MALISRSEAARLKNVSPQAVYKAINQGRVTPVVDNDGGDHSYFANKFIDVLKNNNNVIQSMYLFQNVSEYVINNANQTPNRTVIFGTGDDGGDFLFFPTG